MSTNDPFAPIPLFAVPIFPTQISGFDEHRDALLAHILDHKARYAGSQRSNRNAWHSGEEFVHKPNEHVAWVLKRALKFAHLALAKYYNNWATMDISLAGAWANVVGPGGWNAPHHHFPLHWSGVFYVSVGSMAHNPPGDPSGHIEFLNPTPWMGPMGQGGNFVISPKDGMAVLFPSSLYHFVHPHSSEEERVSIAYNLSLHPKNRQPLGV